MAEAFDDVFWGSSCGVATCQEMGEAPPETFVQMIPTCPL